MFEMPSQLVEFVSPDNNHLVTDTLRVAKHFGKQHKNVLRAYDGRDCSPEFNRLNFEPVEYVDAKGELRRVVQMTKDGFMFLVMGFTGAEVAHIKQAFIAAFNEMATHIHGEQRGLMRQLFELYQRDQASYQLASAGSHAMRQRKADKPRFEAQRFELMEQIQPSLFYTGDLS